MDTQSEKETLLPRKNCDTEKWRRLVSQSSQLSGKLSQSSVEVEGKAVDVTPTYLIPDDKENSIFLSNQVGATRACSYLLYLYLHNLQSIPILGLR